MNRGDDDKSKLYLDGLGAIFLRTLVVFRYTRE